MRFSFVAKHRVIIEVLQEMELALEFVTRSYAVEAAVSNGLALVLARAGIVTPGIGDIIRQVAVSPIKGDDAFLAAQNERVEGLAAAIQTVHEEPVRKKFDA